MTFNPDLRGLRAADIKKLWRLSMALAEATSLRGLIEVMQDKSLQFVPSDGIFYVKLGQAGGALPKEPACHNTTFGENIWRDYTEGGYYKQDPVAVIYSKPGLKNVPVRVNSVPDFYERALYRELLTKYDVHMQMAMRMEYPSSVRVLGLVQMTGARAYTPEDENMLGLLAPHLSRNFEYCELLETSRSAESQAGAVMTIARGARLSRRETEILWQVARGLSNKDTAERLYISEPTVKTHMTRIMRKTGARNRVELLASMLRPPDAGTPV